MGNEGEGEGVRVNSEARGRGRSSGLSGLSCFSCSPNQTNHIDHMNEMSQIPASRCEMLDGKTELSCLILQLIQNESCERHHAKRGSRIECE